jgi:membrane dipeptidase
MKKVLVFPILALILVACATTEEKLERRADRIHSAILTVDTHCDTPMSFSDPEFDLGKKNKEGCVDFPRMVEGGLHSEFFAVFIGQGPRNDSAFDKVHGEALKIFSAIHENISKNSAMAELALTADDAYRIRKDGKIAAFIGLENGYPMGRDISRLKQYYDLGARYITLSHSRNNDICDSSTDPAGPEQGGLSKLGEQVVNEMNRLGMMVDVSHISDEAFYDVLKISSAPVIASHSSCRALCGNPRNLTDDMLLALRDNGGVIQICILSAYLRTPEPNPEMNEKLKVVRSKYGDYRSLPADSQLLYRTEYREIQNKYEKLGNVRDIVDHIDHVVQVAGIDHVGIGTDFDGGGGVEGCRTVSEMKNITIELLRRGYSRQQIEKIWGSNVMRVLRKVENFRATITS